MKAILKKATFAGVALGLLMAGGALVAQEHNGAVKARQSVMQLYAHYLGQLGAMAKGEVDYDAEKAWAVAASLAAVTRLDQSAMWPQGSDNAALGEMTAALPAIWNTYPAIVEKGQALSAAAAEMENAATTDLAALQGAMKALGGACGGCHKSFRQSKD